LCASFRGYAMEQKDPAPLFSTYLGKQLTPKTLPLLAPQMPQDDYVKVRAWITDVRETLKELMKLEKPLLKIPFVKPDSFDCQTGCGHVAPKVATFVAQRRMINKILKHKLNMRNMSQKNCIFDIPGTNYVAQIAGHQNRVMNLLVAHESPEKPGLQYTPDLQCDQVITNWPETFQTVSRLAIYLRAKEAIEKFNLNKIQIPRTYLIGLDERLPGQANDFNSIVIQEKMPHAISIVQLIITNDGFASISAEAVRQLAILTIYAALWDLHTGNLFFDISARTFVISDFEQENTSNPLYFFNKKEDEPLRLGRFGLTHINQLFSGEPHLFQICTKIVQLADNELMQVASGALPASIATSL